MQFPNDDLGERNETYVAIAIQVIPPSCQISN